MASYEGNQKAGFSFLFQLLMHLDLTHMVRCHKESFEKKDIIIFFNISNSSLILFSMSIKIRVSNIQNYFSILAYLILKKLTEYKSSLLNATSGLGFPVITASTIKEF